MSPMKLIPWGKEKEEGAGGGEINKKMQKALEEALMKNIHLQQVCQLCVPYGMCLFTCTMTKSSISKVSILFYWWEVCENCTSNVDLFGSVEVPGL